MAEPQRYSYVSIRNSAGEISWRPILPLTLQREERQFLARGLLDSGADVNVMPYQLGLQLGCDWDNQQHSIRLSGNLANSEAKGVILDGFVGNSARVRLAFAWTRTDQTPLILGQVNFFMNFDVCFYRFLNFFEIAGRK